MSENTETADSNLDVKTSPIAINGELPSFSVLEQMAKGALIRLEWSILDPKDGSPVFIRPLLFNMLGDDEQEAAEARAGTREPQLALQAMAVTFSTMIHKHVNDNGGTPKALAFGVQMEGVPLMARIAHNSDDNSSLLVIGVAPEMFSHTEQSFDTLVFQMEGAADESPSPSVH